MNNDIVHVNKSDILMLLKKAYTEGYEGTIDTIDEDVQRIFTGFVQTKQINGTQPSIMEHAVSEAKCPTTKYKGKYTGGFGYAKKSMSPYVSSKEKVQQAIQESPVDPFTPYGFETEVVTEGCDDFVSSTVSGTSSGHSWTHTEMKMPTSEIAWGLMEDTDGPIDPDDIETQSETL